MELYDAMSTLRAVRRLKPDPIPDDVLQRVLQAAAWAPTGGNAQALAGRRRARRGEAGGASGVVPGRVGSLRGRLPHTAQ